MKPQVKTSFAKKLRNISSWKNGIILFIRFTPRVIHKLYIFTPLFFLLFFYMLYRSYTLIESIPLLGYPLKKLHPVIWSDKLVSFSEKVVAKTERKRLNEAHRVYLIKMADRNLATKKARTVITIAGMSIGIAIIVFLLSIGYGVERLVISQVASLDELRILDVSNSTNTALKLNQDAVKKIAAYDEVDRVVPIISLVGRVSLNKSNTDVLVYAAPKSYFDLTQLPIAEGSVYENDQISFNFGAQVAGAKDELTEAIYGQKVQEDEKIKFNIIPESDAVIWDDCTTQANILGYVPRLEGGFEGIRMWGSEYYPYQDSGRSGIDTAKTQYLGEWVKAEIPVYTKGSDDILRPDFEDTGMPRWVKGCVQSRFIQVTEKISLQSVLGESIEVLAEEDYSSQSADFFGQSVLDSSDSAELVLSDTNSSSESAFLGVEELDATPASELKKDEILTFKGELTKEAVVSLGLLEVLGVQRDKAVGSDFEVSFIVMNTILPDVQGRAFTEKVRYKIVGIIDDLDSPYFYVPLKDMLALGPVTYSQLKVDVNDERRVDGVRLKVEELGFTTTTTLDTVEQIQSLFSNLRILLGLLGLVALGVASLGMFNTLTVSLLERTREIGGMKTMGMVSDEIEDLFLAEAMIMGVAGGVGGLLLGFTIGKVVSLSVSVVSITRGQGFLDLTHIPFFLIAFILISSFVVGVVTGVIPAYRAKKISALNALRYE